MADTVLITGATGTIGQALVTRFAAGGNDVALQFRKNEDVADRLIETVRMQGRNAIAVEADFNLQDVDSLCEAVVSTVADQLSAPNVVVLAASAQDVTPWESLNAEQWDHIYANTIRSTAAMIRAASHQMRNNEKSNNVIVVIGSIEGIRPNVNHAPYATMKAAIHHLVLAAAHELGPDGIRVVGIAPGLVHRDGLEADWPDGVASWNKSAALGRPLTADEIANAVAFVASSAASGITGVTIPVDAGWSAHPGW